MASAVHRVLCRPTALVDGPWRLGAACLLPGALFFLAAIVAYTFHRINLVQLLGATVLHFMIGWVYLLFAPFSLPQEPTAGAGKVRAVNPFERRCQRFQPVLRPSRAGKRSLSSLKSNWPFARSARTAIRGNRCAGRMDANVPHAYTGWAAEAGGGESRAFPALWRQSRNRIVLVNERTFVTVGPAAGKLGMPACRESSC